MAKETNTNVYDMDAGLYDFAASNCGCCHPGGGALEYDRKGHRYDDYLKDGNHPAYLDGDYYYVSSGTATPAPWDTAGVLEADCLLCHMEGYSTNDRATQVKAGHFYAAPFAGAGFGTVVDNDTVNYDSSLATNGITLNVSVHDHNCCQCHAMDETGYTTNSGSPKSDIKKRGFVWGDITTAPTGYERDVHDEANMSCTDCHTAGIDHQIAKGNEKVGTVRDDLDFTVTSCGECHDGTSAVDPSSAHESAGFSTLYSFHMDRIDCTTCHIPHKDTTTFRVVEIAGGGYPMGKYKYGLWFNGSPATPSSWTLQGLKPAYGWMKAADGKYKLFPQNSVTVILWSEKDPTTGAMTYPIYSRDLMTAAAAAGIDASWDDTGDGKAEVNTSAEITAMHDALAALHSSNPNITDPYLWYAPHFFSISHNVRPAAEALGAGGCSDCHATGTWIFDGEYTLSQYVLEDNSRVASELVIALRDGTTEEIDIDFSDPNSNKIENWKLMGYSQSEHDDLVTPR